LNRNIAVFVISNSVYMRVISNSWNQSGRPR